ncbi:MAG: GHMP kinase [Candidatus Aenigmarchaeota archaeon]|nr:GHMP kinase [Candidatus Aenigmarchaeota archaeon]
MIIRSRAPVRISFGGGGTDVPPYCDEHGGCVVSAAINRFSYATLEPRNDGEIEIESGDFLKKLRFGSVDEMTYNNELDLLKAAIKKINTTNMGLNIFLRSNVPPKAGLGGSASCFVALIGLFNHMRMNNMTNYEIAELAHKLEREELHIAGGKQDQYAAVFGGINYIEFGKGWVRVNPLKMKKDHILELEKNLVLAYVGDRPKEDVTREYITGKIKTDDIIGDQVRSIVDRKESVIDAMDKTKEIAQEMRRCLMIGDFLGFGELMHKAWEEKKKFSKMVSNPYIDDLYALARKHGAIGGKITGAGGGGFMLFLCEPNKEQIVSEQLEKAGAKTMDFAFDFDGLQTWEVSYLSRRVWRND